MRMNKVILSDMEMMYCEQANYWDNFADKTVVITGGYGMIASYLIWMFIYLNEYKAKNVKIIVYGRNREKFKERFGEYCDKQYIKLCDDDLSVPIKICEPVNYIFHAASLASPQYYQTMPVDVSIPNVIGTYQLLEFSKKHKEIEGFVFFSSGAVYGEIRKVTFDETDMGILDPLDIRSCYAEGKRMGETFCMDYYTQYGVPCKIVRISHTFGPTMNIQSDKRVFAEFVSNAVAGNDIVIRSDGKAERPFCYITDCIMAIICVLFKGEKGKAYNVNRMDSFYSIKEIAEMIVDIQERKINYRFEMREKAKDYIESINNVAHPSNKKLVELGWVPKIEIKEGFRRTIEFFQTADNEGE